MDHQQGVYRYLEERGWIAQTVFAEEMAAKLDAGPCRFYLGIDPTASSLHVGHLFPIVLAKRLGQYGHQPIFVFGGGTALIGDPSGKESMRPMQAKEEITQHIAAISAQVEKIAPGGIRLNNLDWLGQLQYLDFLRDVGAKFSVNKMLTAECFKQRLEKGLSFLEFNYMILQAYDFLDLFRTHQCTLQIGGNDQWSNILAGCDLVRRFHAETVYGLTCPLFTNKEGKKMGKTEKGAVWLDPNLTPPLELFQYFRNIEDSLVEQLLFFFSEFPKEDIQQMVAHQDERLNSAKKKLAFEVVALVHGEPQAQETLAAAQALYEKGGAADEGIPVVEIPVFDEESRPLIDILESAKLFKSRGEIKRLLTQNGLKNQEGHFFHLEDRLKKVQLATTSGILIFKGKKHCYRLRF